MEHPILIPSQLGPVLRGCRTKKGLTQTELGALAGLPQKVVSAVENHPETPAVRRLFRLLSALDLELVLRDRPPATDGDW